MGSDNGLAPMSQQTVNRSKDTFSYRRIYTSLGLSELNVSPRVPRQWTYFCVYTHAHAILGMYDLMYTYANNLPRINRKYWCTCSYRMVRIQNWQKPLVQYHIKWYRSLGSPTVSYSWVPLQCVPTLHDKVYSNAMTNAENRSVYNLTICIQNLILPDEL